MKFGIIVTDLTADEAQKVLSNLSGQSTTVSVQATNNDDDETGVASTAAFDSTGLPWDERIHASTRAQNKDGSWKARRGVAALTFTNVEAELRATVNTRPAAPVAMAHTYSTPTGENVTGLATSAPAQVYAPPAPQAPVAPVQLQQYAPAPQAPVAPVAYAAPPVAVAPARDYAGLLKQISALFQQSRVAHDYPNTIVARINGAYNITTVTTVNDIANNPDMVSYAWQCLDVDGTAV